VTRLDELATRCRAARDRQARAAAVLCERYGLDPAWAEGFRCGSEDSVLTHFELVRALVFARWRAMAAEEEEKCPTHP